MIRQRLAYELQVKLALVLLLGALAVAAPSLAPASAAADAGGYSDTYLTNASVESKTGGTYVYAELMQRSSDGAVYLNVFVYDNDDDGLCAHGAVGWLHENGKIYYDYGMWHCGYGTGEWFTTPVRNWQDYEGVWLEAFEDGNRGRNGTAYIWWWD